MRASYQWLKELTGIDASPEDMAEKLTAVGLEVEAIHRFPAPDKVVVAEVRALRPHPKRDKLRLVTLTDGSAEDEIVCGAPNVPEPGGRVLFAQLGAALPTESGEPFVISERAIGGVPSRGMICSESELGIGAGGEGIFVFGDVSGAEAPAPGTPLAEALPVGDAVFEIGLTPNRPDCLGHLGIARDLAAIYGVPFSPPTPPAPPLRAEGAVPPADARVALAWGEGGREVALEDDAGVASFAIDIADAARCPRYGAAFVLGATVKPSPFWLRYRLHVLGLRSISNLVDATNLVMLERGHPIHGFDLAKLRGTRIEVRLATEGETLETLDGEERELSTDDLLICDGEGPVALAGVMGGANSEIEAATRHVAIECAYFDPRSVRRTSRRTGLHTDASHRFERGVDPNAVPAVLARAAQLMAELGGGVALAEGLDVVAAAHEAPRITLRRERLDALLGYPVPKDVPARVLAALGATDIAEDDGSVTVTAPSWRPDLHREVDLIEEVARIHGYEHVPTAVPRVRPSATGTAPRIRFERALREQAAAAGLFEAVSYSFVAASELAAARAPTATVALANPLSEERSVMRTSLLPGLMAAARQALRRQAPEVLLFELGRVFAPTGDRLPEETPGSACSWPAARAAGSGPSGSATSTTSRVSSRPCSRPVASRRGSRPARPARRGCTRSARRRSTSATWRWAPRASFTPRSPTTSRSRASGSSTPTST